MHDMFSVAKLLCNIYSIDRYVCNNFSFKSHIHIYRYFPQFSLPPSLSKGCAKNADIFKFEIARLVLIVEKYYAYR